MPIPRRSRTRGCATARPGLRFERAIVESYGEPGSCDAITFLQTIEHVPEPGDVLEHFRALLRRRRGRTSRRRICSRSRRRAPRSPTTRGIVREYRAHEFRELCESVFDSVELYGVYHAAHAPGAWLRAVAGLGPGPPLVRLTRPFYDRFTASISDERLRALRVRSRSTARSTSSLSAADLAVFGDLDICPGLQRCSNGARREAPMAAPVPKLPLNPSSGRA